MVVALVAVALLTSTIAQADDLERHLRDQYRGKIFVIRGFYSDYHLVYDSLGLPNSGAQAGDWTTDGFIRLDDIRLSGQILKIKARRLLVIFKEQGGFQFWGEDKRKKQKPKKSRDLEIEAKFAPGALTEENVNDVLEKVFLNSKDKSSEKVPEFWKPCIADGLSGKTKECRFSDKISAVPGISSSLQTGPDAPVGPTSNAAALPAAVFRVENGVKPPRVTFQPVPAFSEAARTARYQGIVTLRLIVSKDGLPTNIHIINPLAAGLDAEAVKAVQAWKFQPAEKDGRPVAVEIAVEVDFHLY